jgi:hypothetical protein
MIAVDAALERLGARNPYAIDLATLASLAVQVEPELLRDLRMLIPDSDPGTESDLWLSDLVDSKGALGMELVPEVRTRLQQRLRSDPPALERAAAAIRRAHAGISEVVRIEEEITFSALKGEIDDDQLARLLAPIIARIDDDGHAGLARWAMRAFSDMPSAVRDSNVVWHLLRASAVARTLSSPSERPRGVQQMPRIHTRLQLREHGVLEIDSAPDIDVSNHLRGECLVDWIDLPLTNPLMLEVSWGRGAKRKMQRIAFTPGDVYHQPLAADVVYVRTLANDSYRLARRYTSGDWAVLVEPTSPEFTVWLVDDARIAPERLLVVPSLEDVLSTVRSSVGQRCRRLYLHYAPSLLNEIDTHILMSDLRDLSRIATELILVVDTNAPFPARTMFERSVRGFTLIAIGDRFTRSIVAAFRGEAQNTDGEVTAEGVKRYFGQRSDVSVYAGANFVVSESSMDEERREPELLEGMMMTLRRTKRRAAIEGAAFSAASFNGIFVIVAGTGDEELSESEALVVEPLAVALADAGYGVIGSAWPGVDTEMARIFARRVRELGGNVEERLRQYADSSFVTPVEEGTIFESADDTEEPLIAGSMMIAIGGRGGTYKYATHAREIGTPLLAIPETGGDAAELADSGSERNGVRDAQHAKEIVGRVMEWVERQRRGEKPQASEPAGRAPMVFVIYASEDSDRVMAMTSRLKAAGIDVWLDREQLVTEARWEGAIMDAIRRADYVIVVNSKALQSRGVGFFRRELNVALDRGQQLPTNRPFIFPVRIDDAPPLEELSQWQAFDIDVEGGEQQLIESIHRYGYRREFSA